MLSAFIFNNWKALADPLERWPELRSHSAPDRGRQCVRRTDFEHGQRRTSRRLSRRRSRDSSAANLVAACLPIAIAQEGLARGYLRTGACAGNAEPVGKIVGALPGDSVEIEPGWVAVNGARFARSKVATHDSAHRPLPHVAWGSHRVAAGQVWLFGFNDRRSWDSRYFGPIPLANVSGEIKPVVTW